MKVERINIIILLIGIFLFINSVYCFSDSKWNDLYQQFIEKQNDTNKFSKKFIKQFNRFNHFIKNRLDSTDKIPNLIKFKHEFETKFKKNNQEKLLSTNWEELGPKKVIADDKDGGNGRINCIAFNPIKKSEILVGSASGGMWKTDDNGKNWNPIDFTQFMSIGISDIDFANSNPNIVYAATGDADGGMGFGSYSIGIIKSTDNGTSWNLTNNHNIEDCYLIYEIVIHPTDENVVWAATNNGIIKTTDAGENWDYILTGDCFSDIEIHPANPDILYASSFYWRGLTKVVRTNNGGKKWEIIKQFDSINRIELSINKKEPNNLYLIGSSLTRSNLGAFQVSYNNGNDWTDLKQNVIDAVSGQGFYNLVLFNDPKSDSSLFYGGINLCYYDNDSKKNHWQVGPHVDFHFIGFNPYDSMYYCGTDGGIYRTKSPINSTWENISAGLNILQCYKATANPFHLDNLLTGSQDNGVIEYSDMQWNNIMIADGMECVFDNFNPDIYYISSQNGNVIKNTSPLFLNKINMINEEKPWTTHLLPHPQKEGLLYFGYQNLYLFDFKKDTTSKLSDFSNRSPIICFDVFENNPEIIYLAKENDVYKSIDAGKNWESIYHSNTYISSIAINPSNPEICYITFRGFDSEKKVLEYN